MKKTKTYVFEDKIIFYWALGMITIIILGGLIYYFLDCDDCYKYENDLTECIKEIAIIEDSWEIYKEAFDEYCKLDPYETLCSVRSWD